MSETTFRFPLTRPAGTAGRNLNDLLSLHLKELLDIFVLTDREKDLIPDGYRVLNDPETIRPLSYSEEGKPQTEKGPLDLYEPRVLYIRRILESLLSIIEFERDGKTVSVDGFRLKDLNQWLTTSGGATDILAHAASRCNLNCRFCYNRYEPPTLKPIPRSPEEEYAHIIERIQHYVPGAGLNIFPTLGSPAESLTHPRILDILTELRRKTTEIFRLATNGSTLTPEMIQDLQRLGPVYLDISLNSSSPKRRAWLMQDNEPRLALNALKHLQQVGIPYAVVIVPWPFPSEDLMIEDLEETISFAEIFDPALIQISLPGFGRTSSAQELFPHDQVWNRIKDRVLELRHHTGCPIILRPGLFEEFDHPELVNEPVVMGVIKNSPAQLAGLCPGDRILKVNGLPVKNRPQTRSLLKTLHRSELTAASLSIQRQDKSLNLDLHLDRFDYPYTRESATQLGVVFASAGLPESWLERLKEIILARQARQVLLLSSTLVQPVLKNLLTKIGLRPDVNLHVRIPRNKYFGGNIFMGDLMVVTDFIEAINDFISQEQVQPDLVLIPSSPFHLSGWGRDLTGRVYLEIERQTKLPVVLIDCETIYD